MNKNEGFTLWLSGLSGSGKSTLSKEIHAQLLQKQTTTELLDGDRVRQWLTNDLGFSREDRKKNIERVTFICKLLSKNGIGVIGAFITPFSEDREFLRQHTTNFIEVYVNAPIEICEERDTKGLYEKARRGEIENFTGISQAYEEPENPEIEVNTAKETIEESTEKVMKFLEEKGFVTPSN